MKCPATVFSCFWTRASALDASSTNRWTPLYSGRVYELQKDTSKGPTRDVLSHLEPVYLEVSSEIITPGTEEVSKTSTATILLPLADHIAFAITPHQSNHDHHQSVCQRHRLLYPEEYAIACRDKAIIQEAAAIRSTKMRWGTSPCTFTVRWANRSMRAC